MREAEVGFEHLTLAVGWGKVERGGHSWGWGWRTGKTFDSCIGVRTSEIRGFVESGIEFVSVCVCVCVGVALDDHFLARWVSICG